MTALAQLLGEAHGQVRLGQALDELGDLRDRASAPCAGSSKCERRDIATAPSSAQRAATSAWTRRPSICSGVLAASNHS